MELKQAVIGKFGEVVSPSTGPKKCWKYALRPLSHGSFQQGLFLMGMFNARFNAWNAWNSGDGMIIAIAHIAANIFQGPCRCGHTQVAPWLVVSGESSPKNLFWCGDFLHRDHRERSMHFWLELGYQGYTDLAQVFVVSCHDLAGRMLTFYGGAKEYQRSSKSHQPPWQCHGQSWVDFAPSPEGLVILFKDHFKDVGRRYHMIMSRKSQLDHGSFFSPSQTRPRATVYPRWIAIHPFERWELSICSIGRTLLKGEKWSSYFFLCLFVADVFKATQLFWQGYVEVGNAPMPVGL